MFCEKCGKEIPDGSVFCEFCGTPVEAVSAAGSVVPAESDNEMNITSGEASADQLPLHPDASGEEALAEEAPEEKKSGAGKRKTSGEINSEADIEGQKVSENIYLCQDGKYRWIYEYDMLRNPALLITTWKVLGLSFGIVMLFMILVNLLDGSFRYWDAETTFGFFRGFLLLLLFMLALGVVAYLILAASYGWKYMVLFTMDGQGVEHRQMAKQFKKAQAWGWLTAVVGAASGHIGRVGTGILAATKTSSNSSFGSVTKVKSVRSRETIYVNQGLFHNQVYAEAPDFDFVRDYIIRHCVNAKHVS